MRVVLDSDIVIGALDGSDPHHPTSRSLFLGWQERGEDRLISLVNLSAVLVAPAADRKQLQTARGAIAALGITIHRPGEAIGVEAAQLRGSHPISLPDAYCLATADHLGASLATFDARLQRAAGEEGIALYEKPKRRRH